MHKVVDKFYETIDKFIHWICDKFSISEEEDFIRDFEFENNIYSDTEKQIKYEEDLEKEWDLEY